MPFSIQPLAYSCLIIHVSKDESGTDDEQLFATMLTAIQDFVKDSFNTGDTAPLDEMKIGDKELIFERGVNIHMSVVKSKGSSHVIKERMAKLIADIEVEYGSDLEEYSGSPDDLPNIKETIEKFVKVKR